MDINEFVVVVEGLVSHIKDGSLLDSLIAAIVEGKKVSECVRRMVLAGAGMCVACAVCMVGMSKSGGGGKGEYAGHLSALLALPWKAKANA